MSILVPIRLWNYGFAAALLVCAASYAGQIADHYSESDAVSRFAKWIDVNSEGNLPTWLSTMLLGAASLSCLLASASRARLGGTTSLQWAALSATMLFLCVDEAAQIHEKFNVLLRPLRLTTSYYFAWIIPGSVFVLVVGALFLRFLIALPARHRWSIIASGAVFVGGALGIECVEALLFSDETGVDLRYEFAATLQEFLEMTGILLFLRAVHKVLSELSPIRLTFSST